MSNYASASHVITFQGEDLTEGYLGADLTKAGDLQQMDIDLLGNATVSQLADQSGMFTVTYRQGSDSLKIIDAWAAKIQLVGGSFEIPFQGIISHKDAINGESFVGWNAVLTNTGDRNWAASAGERTVTFRVGKVIETNDVISILANIKGYLR